MTGAETLYQGILMACMVVLAILVLVSIIRSVRGPKTADRIIAVNMIGTMTIVIIAILSVYLKESYLVDVCLIYAMISFLSVVVLTKVYTGIYLEKKGIRGDKAAIEDNLEHQGYLEKEEKEPAGEPEKKRPEKKEEE
ncbi:monovalent cation/H+ antiporter complex subunit F [Qiania dongpingensis]|uniref:Sodium:proton antiporter n=1 Tax=Qiania dongpingensis TaxID=2763669 RepID=A0A7G9G3V0_9FIRM|nr:monovalent cation/H+ antiporter complex subunit F [Qiania dongpingensis]QNM05482.1 sodium:proton antiporter [Qiania dongpingensis]